MLALYRSILREHRRRLPVEMRALGDKYVRKEFRDHADVSDVAVIDRFGREWRTYLAHLRRQQARFGADLPNEAIDSMTDDQRQKLIDLRLSSTTIEREKSEGRGGCAA